MMDEKNAPAVPEYGSEVVCSHVNMNCHGDTELWEWTDQTSPTGSDHKSRHWLCEFHRRMTGAGGPMPNRAWTKVT
jgi:hypothetical protein